MEGEITISLKLVVLAVEQSSEVFQAQVNPDIKPLPLFKQSLFSDFKARSQFNGH